MARASQRQYLQSLLRQIEAEDEVILALVMAAVPLIGEKTWRH